MAKAISVRCPDHSDPFECPDSLIWYSVSGFTSPVRRISNDGHTGDPMKVKVEIGHARRHGSSLRDGELWTNILPEARRRRQGVRLSVAIKNAKALRFYERLEFHRGGLSETHTTMECAP